MFEKMASVCKSNLFNRFLGQGQGRFIVLMSEELEADVLLSVIGVKTLCSVFALRLAVIVKCFTNFP